MNKELMEALTLIGYDEDRVKDIAESGAYWQDADPLVKACRKAVEPERPKPYPLLEMNEHGHFDTRMDPLGHYVEANKADVNDVLKSDEDDSDGRSKFMWIRLRNGDLILGVFPQGETYFRHEEKYP
jgi:hypothetical protein